jgi:AraC-like DNA-binding protein
MEAVIEVPGPAVAPLSGAVVTRTITDEAESYNSSVAGIEIEAVRAGAGAGLTQVLAAIGDRFTFTRSEVGFPMLAQTTVPDDMLIVGYVRSATPGSRWCEIDLEPGAVLLYGPAAFHTARNLPGLDFMFAITDRHQMEQHAQQIGCSIEPPSRGCVHLLTNPGKHALVSRSFPKFADAAATGEYPTTAHCDDILRAMAHAMSGEEAVRVVGGTNRIDSRRVVHGCIEYAKSIGRIPSISELCLAAHVSERRLRTAFTDEFEVPPSRFFRAWALEEAHRRLVHADPDGPTVTEVASGLGFDHLGRFSVQYKDMYCESPSTTLRH